MKALLKFLGAVVACLILALMVFSITGLEPRQTRAGLWLKGQVESCPADWSFADKYQTLMVETHPWYLIPHSVTIYFVTINGNMYLHVDYAPGGNQTFPNGKSWTASVFRNPSVRVKLGNQVFDCKALTVTDQAERSAAIQATRKKYPEYHPHAIENFFHVLPD